MLIEDALALILTRVWRAFPNLDTDRLHALEIDLRQEIGGHRVYIPRGRDRSRGDAYREARARGLTVPEAATAAGITIRHARRLEKLGHAAP